MKRNLVKVLSGLCAAAFVLTACAGGGTTATTSAGTGAATSAGTGAATSGGAASGEVIKLGVFEPLSGANAAGGQQEYRGMQVANKLYPEVLGRKIELVTADNKSDKTEAAVSAANLVEKEKVVAVLGSWGSGLSISGGPIFKAAGVPAVGTSCTNPQVTAGNEFYFRVCFIDPFQGTVMARYAVNNLKAKKAIIVSEISSDYSVGLANYFEQQFKKLTGDDKSIVAKLEIKTGDQDFSAQATTIKSMDADVVFLPGNYTESALFIKQARELGVTQVFLGGDTYEYPEFLTTGGEAVNGSTFSTFFDGDKPLNDETVKFLAEYKKMFPNETETPAVAALAYDAYLIVYQAIEKAGSAASADIHKALLETKDFQGAAGVVNFDADRNAIKEAIIKTVDNGKFKFVDVVKPE